MSYNIGDLAASISLNGLGQFNSDLAAAGRSMESTGSQGSKVFSTIRNGLQLTAGATTALTLAGASYVAGLVRTGAAYNTLQQTSRAALTTILGGAQAANDQMAKMDDFARNSPFSKGVFLQAQQQMVGFGIATQKVIPYLQSIQDAVAATGGSNQQIADLTLIMSQISAAGKITGQDLMQFAQRGVNAADLIGSQMGKTGAQIKDEITNGTLDAGKALDALAAGMEATYGGAAAGVKATWDGTTDRIKAASRDIGSALAAPFISPQAGGLAITWGNQVADVLRAVQGQTAPIVSMLTTRLAPAFATITQDLDKARVVVKSWDSAKLEQFLNSAGQYAPAVAGLGGAIVGLNTGLLQNIPILREFVPAIGPIPAAFAAIALSSPQVRSALGDLLQSFSPLLPVGKELATILASMLNSALPVTASLIRGVAAVATPLLRVIAAIPAPILAGAVAFLALNRAATPILPLVQSLIGWFQRMSEAVKFTAMETGASKASVAVQMLGTSLAGAGTEALGFGAAMKTFFVGNAPALIILGVVTAVSALTAAFAAQAQKTADLNKQVAQYQATLSATGKATAATAAAIKDNLNEALGDSWGLTGNTTQSLLKMGLTQEGVTATVIKGGSAYKELISQLKDAASETANVSSSGSGLQDSLTQSAHQAKDLMDKVTGLHDSYVQSEKVMKAAADAQHEAAANMSDDARSYQRFNDALSIVNDRTSDATTKLQALKQALDELKGGAQSAAEQETQLAQSALDVKSALADGNHAWIDAAGAIDLGTQAGVSFAGQLTTINDNMLTAMQSTYQYAFANGKSLPEAQQAAIDSGLKYIQNLHDTLIASGLTEQQTDALIAKYLSTPEVVTTMFGTNIDQVDKDMIGLVLQMAAVPGQKQITVDAPTDAVITALQNVGLNVEKIPNTHQVKISVPDGQTVEGILQNIHAAVDGIPPRKDVTIYIHQDGSASTTATAARRLSADGNLFSSPGVAQAFASGGFPTGIFRGGPPIYKFAEPETGWEAFLSGRRGQEHRNLGIAKEAVKRLTAQAGIHMPDTKLMSFADGGFIPNPTAPTAETLQGLFTDALSAGRLDIDYGLLAKMIGAEVSTGVLSGIGFGSALTTARASLPSIYSGAGK